ncbi:hypothetical protein Srufu_031060 [Streptomyces libani subsp. rufus]|nr:hypothetical protein Srufu_031060 [Streptomyces libani subsp. rufus]
MGPTVASSAPSRTTPKASGATPPAPPLGAGAALTPAPKAKGPVAVRNPPRGWRPGPFAVPGVRPAHVRRRANAVHGLCEACEAAVTGVTGITAAFLVEWTTFFGHGRSCTCNRTAIPRPTATARNHLCRKPALWTREVFSMKLRRALTAAAATAVIAPAALLAAPAAYATGPETEAGASAEPTPGTPGSEQTDAPTTQPETPAAGDENATDDTTPGDTTPGDDTKPGEETGGGDGTGPTARPPPAATPSRVTRPSPPPRPSPPSRASPVTRTSARSMTPPSR